MPKGVEHTPEQAANSGKLDVNGSEMPKGVEHIFCGNPGETG